MPKKIFSADLSVSSINNLIKEIEQYQKGLEFKSRRFAERLAERGVEIARVKVAELDAIFTDELLESIHEEYKGSTPYGGIFAVVVSSTHAVFVEFGTGQRGSDTPYPYPLPEGVSWDYNVGKTIRQNKDGRYYWFYPDQNGQWHYTEGMPSRPFMYETTMELRQILVETAKEVFGE